MGAQEREVIQEDGAPWGGGFVGVAFVKEVLQPLGAFSPAAEEFFQGSEHCVGN